VKSLVLISFSLFIIIPCQARTIYVDANTPDNNDGSSWANAYKYLQDALADANSNPDVNEILVAQGIYTPDSNIFNPNGTGDRSANFRLVNSVAMKGGYAGSGNPDPNIRDIDLYETILNGDLDGNDVSVQDACDLINEPTRGENSYHVVYTNDADANTILDGFTISGGNANGDYPSDRGGGMFNPGKMTFVFPSSFEFSYSNPTVKNCKYVANSAIFGGAIANDVGSPTITNCEFIKNLARYGGGAIYNSAGDGETCILTVTNCNFNSNIVSDPGACGGAISNSGRSVFNKCSFVENSARSGGAIYGVDISLSNCRFIENSAKYDGGGIRIGGESNNLSNCTFVRNSAGRCGGGVFSWYATATLTNCSLKNNRATQGAGMNDQHSNTTLQNCLFTANKAFENDDVDGAGGAMIIFDCNTILYECTFSSNWAESFCGGIDSWDCNGLHINNCIIWENHDSWGTDELAQLDDSNSTLTINYCSIHGLTGNLGGIGNIGEDPCFVKTGYWADSNDTDIVTEPNDPNAIWIDGDYHLKSEGWRWDNARQRWDYDEVTSRCIDAGNPGSLLADELMSIPDDPCNIWGENTRINMGAYGGTTEASIGPHKWVLLSDITNSGICDIDDLAYFTKLWLNTGEELYTDFDRDGEIDFGDFALLANDWLEKTIWYQP